MTTANEQPIKLNEGIVRAIRAMHDPRIDLKEITQLLSDTHYANSEHAGAKTTFNDICGELILHKVMELTNVYGLLVMYTEHKDPDRVEEMAALRIEAQAEVNDILTIYLNKQDDPEAVHMAHIDEAMKRDDEAFQKAMAETTKEIH